MLKGQMFVEIYQKNSMLQNVDMVLIRVSRLGNLVILVQSGVLGAHGRQGARNRCQFLSLSSGHRIIR